MTIYKHKSLFCFLKVLLAFPNNKHYMNYVINLPIFSLVKCFSPREETASFYSNGLEFSKYVTYW